MLFRICAVLCNFYPRPPRGGRPVCFAAGRVSVSISIHALREEGDEGYAQVLLPQNLFLSTPSARRATSEFHVSDLFHDIFLSTPSARRATGEGAVLGGDLIISIHALREEGDDVGDALVLTEVISIHALREEGDRSSRCR